MTKKIRVLAVDDHPLLREGIAAVIDGEDDIELVAEATTLRFVIPTRISCTRLYPWLRVRLSVRKAA